MDEAEAMEVFELLSRWVSCEELRAASQCRVAWEMRFVDEYRNEADARSSCVAIRAAVTTAVDDHGDLRRPDPHPDQVGH